MALSKETKDEIKAMVLIEIEKMFTELEHKYNSKENHDMMLFLMDVESAIKQRLTDFYAAGQGA